VHNPTTLAAGSLWTISVLSSPLYDHGRVYEERSIFRQLREWFMSIGDRKYSCSGNSANMPCEKQAKRAKGDKTQD
jgi:hypothetical protein